MSILLIKQYGTQLMKVFLEVVLEIKCAEYGIYDQVKTLRKYMLIQTKFYQ
jgi:hypothetical protein